MPFSSTSVEPHLQPVIERAFEAAWRELRLTPGTARTPHDKSIRAELARRIKAAATKGERDPRRVKLMALRAYRPGLPSVTDG
jgi:hypothetical protein